MTHTRNALARAAGALTLALAFALATALTAVVIVTPLWFVATEFRLIYTAVAAAALLASATVLLIRRIKRRDTGTDVPPGRHPVIRGIVLGIPAVILCYVVGILYWGGVLAAAIPLTAVLLALTGYAIFARRASKR